jgi:hypothetical protein|tara:strand:- start:6 stop:836 length:831 start_codon:yes stop_codon:yes gene_type:complete
MMFVRNNLINKPILFNILNKNSVLVLENSTSISENDNKLSIIPGFGLGFPLNILQLGYTYLHYNDNIITPELFFLQFCIGIFTYGTDRFLDSENYDLTNSTEIINLSNKKREYYLYLQDNKIVSLSIILVSYIFLLDELLIQHENLRILFYILTSTIFYKNIKENFGILKPVYIATLWTVGTIVLPCIIYENNFDILNDPIVYTSSFFLLFGSSNLMDIEDIEEDREENIKTIPVVYGKKVSQYISYLSLTISTGLILEKILELYQNEIISHILIS